MNAESKNFIYKPNLMTLCFIRNGNQVLLGKKARKIGQGLWNGIGGNVEESDETIESAARREVQEEIGVAVTQMIHLGKIDFIFPALDGKINQVYMFVADGYKGELSPKPEEIRELHWFDVDNLPTDEMLPADRRFIPLLLENKVIQGEVTFTPEFDLLSADIKVLSEKPREVFQEIESSPVKFK